MKYDCTKTQDCIHEYRRLCDSHSAGCENDCPFCGMDNCHLDSFDEDMIALLQKWSDEHLEKPKLTKREYEFLSAFSDIEGKAIVRFFDSCLYVRQYSSVRINSISIDPSMFPFISEGEEWYFDKLLGLEVEE